MPIESASGESAPSPINESKEMARKRRKIYEAPPPMEGDPVIHCLIKVLNRCQSKEEIEEIKEWCDAHQWKTAQTLMNPAEKKKINANLERRIMKAKFRLIGCYLCRGQGILIQLKTNQLNLVKCPACRSRIQPMWGKKNLKLKKSENLYRD